MSIPITIVGGYLGAGKTSLINHILAAKHGRRVTVLVNDFGAINIDAALIADSADDTISLTNGCACCAIQDDLGAALQAQIERASPPDSILIEMSGVAEPARIKRYAEAWPGVHLDAILTLADAETVLMRADDKFVGRVVQRQLSAADFLVLNKVDLVSEAERARTAAWLHQRNPGSRLIETTHGVVDAVVLFEPAVRKERPRDFELGKRAQQAADVFHTDIVDIPAPIDVGALEQELARLPASIHRIKGFVTNRASASRLLVQVVGNRIALSEAPTVSGESPDALVVIGTDEGDVDAVSSLIARLWQPETAASA
jgi:G3E family GTPase